MLKIFIGREMKNDLLTIDQRTEKYPVAACKFKKEPFAYTEYLNTLAKLTPSMVIYLVLVIKQEHFFYAPKILQLFLDRYF